MSNSTKTCPVKRAFEMGKGVSAKNIIHTYVYIYVFSSFSSRNLGFSY